MKRTTFSLSSFYFPCLLPNFGAVYCLQQMNHCRLIYKSTAVEDPVSNESIRNLIDHSSKKNTEAGITGLLLLCGRHFLQVLEGPAEKVNALFQKISADSRHDTVELIEFRAFAEPMFEDWSMRLVDLYDLPGEKRELLMDKYDHADGEIFIPKQSAQVISLLLDARAICLTTPWTE